MRKDKFRQWFFAVGLILCVPGKSAAGVITVNAGDDFQAALNTASPGDTILLQAGATFTGNFVLPKKAGTSWIVIRSSTADANLPPPNSRITPAYGTVLPKIVSPNTSPAILGDFGAHHFRFIGVEITTTWASHTSGTHYNLILFGYDANGTQATSLGQLPHNITFDRCYIHGTPTGNVRRGIALNAASVIITNSHFAEFHEVGVDSQAIGGWNGPGPFTIENNYIQAAGENVMFGGAATPILNLIPSDIVFRKNFVTKPLRWRVGDRSYAGIHWTVKNLLELKNAQRVTIEGNIFEYAWADAQVGDALVFTPRNADGRGENPWSTVKDVIVRNNIIRHAVRGINILGRDSGFGYTSRYLENLVVENNLFYDLSETWGSGSGVRFAQILSGPKSVVFRHNTAVFSPGNLGATFVFDDPTRLGPTQSFVADNNLLMHGSYGIFSTANTAGSRTLAYYAVSYSFSHNIMAGMVEAGGSLSNYPGTTLTETNAAFMNGFVDAGSGNYRLRATALGYRGATDGTDIGVNMDVLTAAVSDTRVGSPAAPTNVKVMQQ